MTGQPWVPPIPPPDMSIYPAELTCPPKEVRIRYIIDLMAQGHFVTGVTGGDLMILWGLSQSTMLLDCAEASRRLRFAHEDIDAIRAQAVATQQTIISRAMAAEDWSTAERANQGLARLTGVYAPVRVNVALPDVATLFGEFARENDEPRRQIVEVEETIPLLESGS